MLKRLFPILVLLVIIAIAWLVSSIYQASTDVKVDARVDSYIQPVRSTIDTQTLNGVIDRAQDNLEISPQVLKDLDSSRKSED